LLKIKMINKFKFTIIFTFVLALTSCGYQKVIQNDEPLVYINEFNVESSNKRLAYLIKNEILLVSKKNAKNKILYKSYFPPKSSMSLQTPK